MTAMTAGKDSELSIEALDDHVYLVQATVDDDDVVVRVRVAPSFTERLEVPQASDVEIVTETMTYLLQRQRLDDLPSQLDLEDVSAAYPDFEDSLRQALGASEA